MLGVGDCIVNFLRVCFGYWELEVMGFVSFMNKVCVYYEEFVVYEWFYGECKFVFSKFGKDCFGDGF